VEKKTSRGVCNIFSKILKYSDYFKRLAPSLIKYNLMLKCLIVLLILVALDSWFGPELEMFQSAACKLCSVPPDSIIQDLQDKFQIFVWQSGPETALRNITSTYLLTPFSRVFLENLNVFLASQTIPRIL
jgi:hypothetical protein